MSTPSQHENMFSEGLATGQPPIRAEVDAARQDVSDECHALSVKAQIVNTGSLIIFVVATVVYLMREGVFLIPGSNYGFFPIAGSHLLSLFALHVVHKRLAAAMASRQSILAGLLPMSPEQQPDACIAYAALGDEHETIRAYQRQIAAQGRLPVMAEYTYAEAWVIKQREQQTRDAEIAAAKAACQQWTKPA